MVGKLVTPNLIPSTGPAGGGDGKTDLETYSVDDAISENGIIQMLVKVTKNGLLL